MIVIGDMRIDNSNVPEISDYTFDREIVRQYIRSELRKQWPVRIDFIAIARACGFWEWVIQNCPNRRVVHLMRHSKDRLVVKKNFLRAERLIYEELVRKGAEVTYDQT